MNFNKPQTAILRLVCHANSTKSNANGRTRERKSDDNDTLRAAVGLTQELMVPPGRFLSAEQTPGCTPLHYIHLANFILGPEPVRVHSLTYPLKM